MQKILRFFLQPWNQYSTDELPPRRVAHADHAWSTYIFVGDEEDLQKFIEEIRNELQEHRNVWLGILLRDMPTHDEFGLIYIVDCNPNYHSSVAEPQRQFDRLVNYLGGERIINEQ